VAASEVLILTDPGEEEGRTAFVTDQPSNVTAFLTPQVDEINNQDAQNYGN
jgi:hypothetical protein